MQDNLNITGLIDIIDNKTGKNILSTHNMIVNNGREFILNKTFGYATTKEIKGIFISNTTGLTSNSNNDNSNILNSNSDDIILIEFDSPEEVTIAKEDNADSSGRPSIKITLNNTVLKNRTISNISSIGIYLENIKGSTPENELFSRAVFDPILLNEDSDFTIIYRIYV